MVERQDRPTRRVREREGRMNYERRSISVLAAAPSALCEALPVLFLIAAVCLSPTSLYQGWSGTRNVSEWGINDLPHSRVHLV